MITRGDKAKSKEALHEVGTMVKVHCTGYPACGFHDCPHASPHEPYAFGGSDGDGETCETAGPCEQWQQRPGIGPKKSRCRCVEEEA